MNLRKHQKELQQIVDDTIAGSPIKTIICEVTPGGGKSFLPIIAGKLIAAGNADSLCWICPRKTLQNQGEQNFQDPLSKELLQHDLTIRSSTNDINPCRGLNGFITTYQAFGVDEKQTVLTDFSSKRYILILDEFHHAEEGGIWHEALQPLVNRAKYKILMTGTMERGNGAEIAFINNYSDHPDTVAKIKYGRKAALAEKAIIPLHFSFSDGNVRWIDYDGQEIKYDSIANMPKKDVAKAIYTAITTKYAEELLSKGLSHWIDHKKRCPSSKLLIVTANVALAKKAIAFLEKYRFRTEIATSHESTAAQIAIRRFKAGYTDILVGVAMFYEGFDCKQVSHIISLTHIRSKPWLEQMFARAVRIDPDAGPYETQYGYIFAPDDPLFRNVVKKIQSEQAPFIKKQMPKNNQSLMFDSGGDNGLQEPGGNIYNIIPVGSALTNGREITLGQQLEQPESISETPSEIEADLRNQIESHVRQFSFINRYNPKRLNAEIKRHFNKARDSMTSNELEIVLAHVKRVYPLNGSGSLSLSGNQAKPRGGGVRVPTKAMPWHGKEI